MVRQINDKEEKKTTARNVPEALPEWFGIPAAVILLCLFASEGCGKAPETRQENMLSSEIRETESGEHDPGDISGTESEDIAPDGASETESGSVELSADNGTIMELYAGGDVISVSENTMTAQVSPEELLKGSPVLYDRFKTDGLIFEWLISDYYDDDNCFSEDGVLVVSREGDAEDAQIIHVEAEGGYAAWVPVENKFEYVDVNFDSLPDVLICTGHHGNQGLLTYYCFLQTENGFVEAPTFTGISNPAVDAEHELILSQWRNSAASHSWAEYKCEDNAYTLYRELREDAVWDEGEDIWVWTVNGEEIGRSDKLSDEEIEDLIYNENSEWKITDDRWRSLYNHGLTADYSIYAEP